MLANFINGLTARNPAQTRFSSFAKAAVVSLFAGFALLCMQAPTYAQAPNAQGITKSESVQSTKPAAKIDWSKLSSNQQLALAPVQKNWTEMSAAQQKHLVSAAKDFSKLQPIQKERFQSRLRDWAALTPEQRKLARTKYETLSKLPPAKQFEIHEKWQDKQAANTIAPSAPAAITPTNPVAAGTVKP